MLAVQAAGARVETVSALAEQGSLHPLQQELIERGAVQCGFCTPGIVLGSLEALRLGLAGDRLAIRRSLAGNLCRCTGYGKIVDAVEAYRDRDGAA
jgi:carbon-monoxide dehydrogenase small subunit